MVVMSGGLDNYFGLALSWANQHTGESVSSFGFLKRMVRLTMFTAYCVGVGSLPMLWALWRYRRDVVRFLRAEQRAQLLVVWVLPALLYFVFVHLNQSGHMFTIMPALIILMALAIRSIGQLDNCGRTAWITVLVLTVACNGLFFLLGPASLFGIHRIAFTPPTWSAIREYDADILQRLDAIHETFEPEETVVLAAGRNYRLPDFYLPDYQLTSLSHELGDDIEEIVLPEHVRTLVLFDNTPLPELVSGPHLYSLALPDGKGLRYVEWGENQMVRLDQTSIEIQERKSGDGKGL